jgi:hypothetical protein
MTSYSRGLLVSWSKRAKSNKSGGRVFLNKKAPLNKKVFLNRRVVF